MSEKRWGATPEEWDLFVELGLTADLLPVVSDPDAAISPTSKMKQLGKTPSMFNRDGLVIGLSNWTERETTSQLISSWKKDPRLGTCLQTRMCRALDVDIKDPILASKVRAFLQKWYKFPIRFRADSSKFLVCFYLEGSITKRVIKLDDQKKGPMIEFLANGQQFVAAGTHQDGARYEWDWGGHDGLPSLSEPPTLTMEQFEELWAALVAEFGVSVLGGTALRRGRVAGSVVSSNDPIAKYLETHESFIGVAKDGKVMIDCPWIANHSTDNGETQTTYMPPGDRGYQQGHFKCLHAGCADKHDNDFLDALGYNNTFFEALPEQPAKPGADKNLPALLPIAFRRSELKKKWGVAVIFAELENVVKALARPDFCGYHLRYDTFLGDMMYASVDDPTGWMVLNDDAKVKLRHELEHKCFDQVGRELIRDALGMHSMTHRFDSAIEWLTNEVPAWDGVPRIDTFLTDVANVEDSEYTQAVSRYLWTALAGRTLQPGVKADMVPIFVGEQGVGKSMLVEALAPAPEFYVSLSLHEKDDNLARLMKAHLVAELAELNGLKTRAIESIKKFIALQHDSWIPKYQESQTNYKRRLVFVGTTNDNDFLSDATGNRRWLPVEVSKMSMDALAAFKVGRAQYWAEARDRFWTDGIDWSAQWLAGEAHEKYSTSDIWEDVVVKWLDECDTLAEGPESTPRWRGFAGRNETFMTCLGMDLMKVTDSDIKRLGAIFSKLRFRKGKKRINGKEIRGWHLV